MMETQCWTRQLWSLEKKTLKKQEELKGEKILAWLLVHENSVPVSQNQEKLFTNKYVNIWLTTKIGENTEQSLKKKMSCSVSFAIP